MSRSLGRSGEEGRVDVDDRGTPQSIQVTSYSEFPQRVSPHVRDFLTQVDTVSYMEHFRGVDTNPSPTGNGGLMELDRRSNPTPNSPLQDQYFCRPIGQIFNARPTSQSPSNPEFFFGNRDLSVGRPMVPALSTDFRRLQIAQEPSPQAFGGVHASSLLHSFSAASSPPLTGHTGTPEGTSVSPDTPLPGFPQESRAFRFPPSYNERESDRYSYEQTQDVSASRVHGGFNVVENENVYHWWTQDDGRNHDSEFDNVGLKEFVEQMQINGGYIPEPDVDPDLVRQLLQSKCSPYPCADASVDTGPSNDPVHENEQKPGPSVFPTTMTEISPGQRSNYNSSQSPVQGQVINPEIATNRVIKHTLSKRKNAASYVCHVCKRDFTAAHNLRHHLNSHLGNRPYPCKHCSYRSGTSHTLKRHVLAKHSGECGPSKMPSGLCKRLASS